MKTDRRHELQESDLVSLLRNSKQYLDDHGRLIAFSALAILLAIVGVYVTSGAKAASLERAWEKRRALDLSTPESAKENLGTLIALAVESKDDAFAMSVLSDVAKHGLRLAQKVEFPPDEELNEMARKALELLLEKYGDRPIALGVAHAGLATVAENDFVRVGDASRKKAARKHLQSIIDSDSLTTLPFRKIAEDRLARLDITFSQMQFAPSPLPEKTNVDSSAEPTTITKDGETFMKMQVNEEGKLEPVGKTPNDKGPK